MLLGSVKNEFLTHHAFFESDKVNFFALNYLINFWGKELQQNSSRRQQTHGLKIFGSK